MKFNSNSETAFAVVSRRTTGSKTPKLSKVVGELLLCPDEAIDKAAQYNLEFDPSGESSVYAAVEVEVSFIKELEPESKDSE